MSEARERLQQFRTAHAKVLVDNYAMDWDVATTIADAWVLFQVIGQLPFNVARSLAFAGYFTPNEVIRASDKELLAVNGIGPAYLRKIRETYAAGLHPDEPTTEELLEDLIKYREESEILDAEFLE